MQLSEVFLQLGADSLPQLLRGVSMGKLRTYQLFDRVKARFHLAKLNQENLRKASPRLWERLSAGDEELASDLSQAILVSHLELIIAVLDFLGIPHNEGFFEKEADAAAKLAEGWQQKAFTEFQGRFPREILVFYLNHLAREVAPGLELFRPQSG